jgi:16S rRNA processing protein RimM
MFDMITLKGYNNINEVLKYKYENVYVKRSDLNLNENDYLLDDLIGMKVIDNNEVIGKVIDYNQGSNVLLKISGVKEFYIPLVDEYVINVDLKNKEIHTKNGKDLIL